MRGSRLSQVISRPSGYILSPASRNRTQPYLSQAPSTTIVRSQPKFRPVSVSLYSHLPAISALFSTTVASLGKKSKKKGGASSPSSGESAENTEVTEDEEISHHPKPDPTTPNAFPDVESRFQRAGERFADLVRKLRSGQTSMMMDEIGSVRVRPDRESPETYPLRELAAIIQRQGRAVSILVHEASYIKPIMSAVQASPEFNQQPQRSTDNELELTMKIQRETPQEMQRRVRDAAQAYKEAIRLARQRREKFHARWVKGGEWGVDLKFQADKELQKMVEKKNTEIDKLEAQTMKSIASMRLE